METSTSRRIPRTWAGTIVVLCATAASVPRGATAECGHYVRSSRALADPLTPALARLDPLAASVAPDEVGRGTPDSSVPCAGAFCSPGGVSPIAPEPSIAPRPEWACSTTAGPRLVANSSAFPADESPRIPILRADPVTPPPRASVRSAY